MKLSTDLQSLSVLGRLFHNYWGAAEANARSPHDRLVLGMIRVDVLAERRPERPGLRKLSREEMYCGEENFKGVPPPAQSAEAFDVSLDY